MNLNEMRGSHNLNEMRFGLLQVNSEKRMIIFFLFMHLIARTKSHNKFI